MLPCSERVNTSIESTLIIIRESRIRVIVPDAVHPDAGDWRGRELEGGSGQIPESSAVLVECGELLVLCESSDH